MELPDWQRQEAPRPRRVPIRSRWPTGALLITCGALILAGALLRQPGITAACLALGLIGLLFGGPILLVVGRAAPREVFIGTDGIELIHAMKSKFYPYAELEGTTAGHLGTELVLRGGKKTILGIARQSGGLSPDERASQAANAVSAALSVYQQLPPPSAEVRRTEQMLMSGADAELSQGSYRQSGLDRERLWDLVESVQVDMQWRLAALAKLGPAQNDTERQLTAKLAQETASKKLRRALKRLRD